MYKAVSKVTLTFFLSFPIQNLFTAFKFFSLLHPKRTSEHTDLRVWVLPVIRPSPKCKQNSCAKLFAVNLGKCQFECKSMNKIRLTLPTLIHYIASSVATVLRNIKRFVWFSVFPL